MMLKVVSSLILTFKKVFQPDILPKLIEGQVPLFKTVELGRVSDPSAKIEYPALYVFRGPVELSKLSLNNVAQPRNPFAPQAQRESYIQLYTTSILFEILAENLLQWEQLADTVARTVLTIKPHLLKVYKLHDLTNPSISPPEIQERGGKVWVGQISFTIYKQGLWKTTLSGDALPILEGILLDVYRQQQRELHASVNIQTPSEEV